MIKLNHKHYAVLDHIDALKKQISELGDYSKCDISTDLISDTVIYVTITFKGYRWIESHCFNWIFGKFLYHSIESVWQLDNCENPIFEV